MPKNRTVCEVDAFAKLNLFLEVKGRRSDGFHEIRSIALPVELCDKLRFRVVSRGGLRVRMHGAGVHGLPVLANNDNLAVRAARLAGTGVRRPGNLRIAINKRIPVGGGLGGGSANAAATLVAFDYLGDKLEPGENLRVAAALGSDVPALLQGGAVVMSGRGEKVEPMLPSWEHPSGFWIVLANPGIHVATAEIYGACKRLTPPPYYYKNMVCAVRTGDVALAARSLFNGLQSTVFDRYPSVHRLFLEMNKAGAMAAMVCGSGGSVFGLAENRTHAMKIKQQLPRVYWSRVSRTLPDGVMVAHGPLEP